MLTVYKFSISESGNRYIVEIKAESLADAASLIFKNLPMSTLEEMPEVKRISVVPISTVVEFLV